MPQSGPAVIELEHYGVPFSRTEEGKIYQRPFGGMTTNYGEGTAQRTCAAADRTGHAILHTSVPAALRHDAEFFIEYFALDLIMDDEGACRGVIAWDHPMARCMRMFRAHQTVLATGGYGAYFRRPRPIPAPATATAWCCAPDYRCRTWSSPSSIRPASTAPAADHRRLSRRRRLPDQLAGRAFHGTLCAERQGPGFRDVVSRSMTIEIREGRGVGDKDHIHLHLEHLGPDDPSTSVAGHRRDRAHFAGVDVTNEPHASAADRALQHGRHSDQLSRRGGHPQDGNPDHVIPGLMAIGEAACVSVHGANRLGSNSLLDIVVFGPPPPIVAPN